MKLDNFSGKWAIVTGASAGIGKGYLETFASYGINLILVARRQELLEKIASKLEKDHNISVECIPMDLSYEESANMIFTKIEQKNLKVHILVNAAVDSNWGLFKDAGINETERIITINNKSVVNLCSGFIKQISNNESGIIINFSSQAAYLPVPFSAVYSASKGFVRLFSLALYRELLGTGIYVQTIEPGHTSTESMEKIGVPKESKFYKSAKPVSLVVAASIKGIEKEQPLVTNIKSMYFFRLGIAFAPIKSILNQSYKMFEPLVKTLRR